MAFFTGRFYIVALGSNGTTIDSQGRLVFCAHGDHAIKRLEKNGTVTVLADRFEGKRFNGPNDIVMRSDDVVYFSDNIGGLPLGAQTPNRELPYFGLFMVKDGRVTLVDREPLGQNPNGLGISPDQRYLYVGAGLYIFRYELQKDGMPTNRQVLVDMTKLTGGVDGLDVDVEGNLYFVGPGGIRVVTPAGRHLGTIKFPPGAHPANLAFGGADGRTLFVTGAGDLYRLPVKVGGRPPGPDR
jgi:gluconolactonase